MSKFKIGDSVKHDFSQTFGTVLDVRNDPDGYNYKVEFVIENGLSRIDWYKEKVLVEAKF